MMKYLLVIFLCFISTAFQGKAELVRLRGSSDFVIRIDFEPSFTHQVKKNWCWAACVQMIIWYYYREFVSQSDIVKKVYGFEADITANKKDIVEAIDGWKIGNHRIKARYNKGKTQKAIMESLLTNLSNGIPIIVGLNEDYDYVGHAYVLTHLYFTKNSNGETVPWKVRLVNPSKEGSDLEEDVSWSDFYERLNTTIIIEWSNI